MTALDAHMQRTFVDRMAEYLRTEFPAELEAALGTEPTNGEVPELVREGIQRAAEHSIETERDVGRFLELMLLMKRDFDQRREYIWARRILIDKTLSGQGKVEMIHQQREARMKDAEKSSRDRPGV